MSGDEIEFEAPHYVSEFYAEWMGEETGVIGDFFDEKAALTVKNFNTEAVVYKGLKSVQNCLDGEMQKFKAVDLKVLEASTVATGVLILCMGTFRNTVELATEGTEYTEFTQSLWVAQEGTGDDVTYFITASVLHLVPHSAVNMKQPARTRERISEIDRDLERQAQAEAEAERARIAADEERKKRELAAAEAERLADIQREKERVAAENAEKAKREAEREAERAARAEKSRKEKEEREKEKQRRQQKPRATSVKAAAPARTTEQRKTASKPVSRNVSRPQTPAGQKKETFGVKFTTHKSKDGLPRADIDSFCAKHGVTLWNVLGYKAAQGKRPECMPGFTIQVHSKAEAGRFVASKPMHHKGVSLDVKSWPLN
ncbi:hypothetical protein KIPB_007138 [Kipferlia bialata]|uniref:NTF2 domain-containing protein n=1 Tax=Kipferlia bialata TaxID=797122 RepID=A0A9K3GJQ6_9EUKA|nr:hypothetical protein KIPB_007138 [Kipferlia bialata]|eukprot:g7138.t1